MSHHNTWTRQPETAIIAGSVATDVTTGAITAGSTRGKGFSVTKPAATTGVYRIAFTSDGTRKYPRILSVLVSIEDEGDTTAVVTSSTASDGYVDITTKVAGAAADLSLGRIHFLIVVQNTSVGTV